VFHLPLAHATRDPDRHFLFAGAGYVKRASSAARSPSVTVADLLHRRGQRDPRRCADFNRKLSHLTPPDAMAIETPLPNASPTL
jgi:hypothetical protein